MHNAAHKEEQAKGELICEFSLWLLEINLAT